MTEVIVWDNQDDSRPILNRAKAGMSAFLDRAVIEGYLQITSDPTIYKPGKGYEDYNSPVQFSLTTKRSDWGAKRMAILQGILLFHVTNGDRVESWTPDVTEKLGFDRPTLAVSSGTDGGVTIFVGERVDLFAEQVVRRLIFDRAIRGEDIFDSRIEWCPDYDKLATEVQGLIPA
jgi:hypothetical protein